MDLSQLLRALGLQQSYQSYQENIGQPFADVAGPFGRGLLGLERPEYGQEQAYRTGQALSNMPGTGAPAGLLKAAAQAPEVAGMIGALASLGTKAAPVAKVNFGQEATRKSINDLIKYMNDTGQPYTSGPLPKETDPSSMLAVLNDLDYYLGMVPPPQYITDANKAKVRELWSNIEKNNAQWFRSDPEHPAVIMRRQMEESMKTPE